MVIERDTDSEESSSEEDIEDGVVQEPEPESESEEEEEEEVKVEGVEEKVVEEVSSLKKKGKQPITISLKKVCKVRLLFPNIWCFRDFRCSLFSVEMYWFGFIYYGLFAGL